MKSHFFLCFIFCAMLLCGCVHDADSQSSAVDADSQSSAAAADSQSSAVDTDNQSSAADADSQSGTADADSQNKAEDKPVIVCTLFPQYDFARTLFGDKAQVIMLLQPGMESHMYDPTPQDMVTISGADAFIYTGDEMEPWAAQIVESLDDVTILDLSAHVNLEMEDEHEDHESEHEHEHHDHEHSYDPHFWLDLDNAQMMITAIEDLAMTMFPEEADAIGARADAYKEKLADLDAAYFEAVDQAAHKDIVFAGRFAYGYFVHRYDLHYETVYQGCSANADPSIYDMARVIDYIKENDTKIVFYEELSNASVAKTIAEDTGVQIRMLSTAHNVTKEEFDAGITFYDVMANNLEVLKEALNAAD